MLADFEELFSTFDLRSFKKASSADIIKFLLCGKKLPNSTSGKNLTTASNTTATPPVTTTPKSQTTPPKPQTTTQKPKYPLRGGKIVDVLETII